MTIFRLVIVIFLASISNILFAAPAPKPKPEEDKPGIKEIDFSMLPMKGAKYALRISVKTTEGSYSQKMQFDDEDTPQSVRELFYESLKSSGHDVEYVGDYIIRIKSQKGLPIKACVATSDTLGKDAVPKVRALQK